MNAFRRFLALMAASLLAYFCCRLLFALANAPLMSDAQPLQWVRALGLGLRFDLAFLCLLNLPLLLLSLAPWPGKERRFFRDLQLGLFLLLNLPGLLLNLIDIEYYAISGRRLGRDLLKDQMDEIIRQLPQFAVNYWYFPVLTLGLGMLALHLWRRIPLAQPDQLQTSGHPWLKLGLWVLLFAGALHGSLDTQPLSPQKTLEVGHVPLAALALNTPFVLWRESGLPSLQHRKYFPSTAAARSFVDTGRAPLSPHFGQGRGQNVVLVILESFGSEYTSLGEGVSYTPVLDGVMKEGQIFKRHFANGRESVHALPSLLAGLPHLLKIPYVSSSFATRPLQGAGQLLKSVGYGSAFFHGGRNGTMHFDTFVERAGLDRYYGLNQYPDPTHYDGVWGVPDHLYLPWVANELGQLPRPFFAGVFTLSSHQPYYVAPELKGRFPKGTLAIHESIGYADYALGLFLEAARKQSWYEDTLFIVTADHTQKCEQARFCRDIGRYQVPLLLFHPKKNSLAPAAKDRVTQHVDIFWTLLDYVGVPLAKSSSLPPFGQSLWAADNPGEAYQLAGGAYRIVRGEYFLELWGQKTLGPWRFDTGRAETHPELAENLRRRLEAVVQSFDNGLLEKSWSQP